MVCRSFALLATLMACASSASLAAEGQPATPRGGTPAVADPLNEVVKMVSNRQYAEAKASLSEMLKKKPENWRAVMLEDDYVVRAYWELTEFVGCAALDGKESNKNLVWRGPSYSKAHFLLAFILQAEGDGKGAAENLNAAIALEPDAPAVLTQLGFLRIRSNPREAIRYFEKAQQRSCAGNHLMAAAYRGQGVALAQLRELDAAEQALRKSLELSPGNKNAESELRYVESLRSGGARGPLVAAAPAQSPTESAAPPVPTANCGPTYPAAFPCLGGGQIEQLPPQLVAANPAMGRTSMISYGVAHTVLAADLDRKAIQAGWRVVGSTEAREREGVRYRRRFEKEGVTVGTSVWQQGNRAILSVF